MHSLNSFSTGSAGSYIRQLQFYFDHSIDWIDLLPARRQQTQWEFCAFAASDPVIAAAGDIDAIQRISISMAEAKPNTPTECREKGTYLFLSTDLAAVLPLGDVQYYCGGYAAFQQSYDSSWGRVNQSRIRWWATMSISPQEAQTAQEFQCRCGRLLQLL